MEDGATESGLLRLVPSSSQKTITEAVEIIASGGAVVYPTDTLYGLGVDARNKAAVARLSQIKGRPGPWSVAVADFEMLTEHCEVPYHHRTFVKSQLPGAVTLILPGASIRVAADVYGADGTVGVRIPDHPVPMALAKSLGGPITSTSVNRTGESPLSDPRVISVIFGGEIDLIIDEGTLPASGGSTIYDLTADKIKTVR